MDLDNFKHYNDSFGHPAGDAILAAFTRIVLLCVRDLDSLGRYGGDEFILVLPATNPEGAQLVAGRILEKVKEMDGFKELIKAETGKNVVIADGKKLGCSIGISLYDPTASRGIPELIEAADAALYQAKKSGKGCIKLEAGA